MQISQLSRRFHNMPVMPVHWIELFRIFGGNFRGWKRRKSQKQIFFPRFGEQKAFSKRRTADFSTPHAVGETFPPSIYQTEQKRDQGSHCSTHGWLLPGSHLTQLLLDNSHRHHGNSSESECEFGQRSVRMWQAASNWAEAVSKSQSLVS